MGVEWCLGRVIGCVGVGVGEGRSIIWVWSWDYGLRIIKGCRGFIDFRFICFRSSIYI